MQHIGPMNNLLYAILLAASFGSAFADSIEDTARGIHTRTLTLDTHIDINPKDFTTERNPGMRLDGVAVDLPKMNEGGLDAGFFIVYVGQGDATLKARKAAHEKALEKFRAIHRMTEEINPDTIQLALSSADVTRIWRSGKKVAMIGVENAYPLEYDQAYLKDFHDLGARYISLTHNKHNLFADSNYPKAGEPASIHNGVSDAGRNLISEANKLGIMLDISHASKKSALDIINYSSAPVIASHSAVDNLLPHSRNLDDEVLKALKSNNGVVHIVAFRSYLKETPHEKMQRLNELAEEFNLPKGDIWSEGDRIFSALFAQPKENIGAYFSKWKEITRTSPHADISDLIDHVDYVVNKIGIDHVGISSDFGGGGGVDGWEDASQTFNITLELVRRGYTEADIAKIWSGNLLRVWADVEAVAAASKQ
ncbi:MAG: peptidase M19 [marine bacterium B5-7]|nr:MAG: peptidase M19 [marine bacterium B5-7]